MSIDKLLLKIKYKSLVSEVKAGPIYLRPFNEQSKKFDLPYEYITEFLNLLGERLTDEL